MAVIIYDNNNIIIVDYANVSMGIYDTCNVICEYI